MTAPRNPSGRLIHGGMAKPERAIDARYISDPDPEAVRKECERAWLEVERMGLDKPADIISHKGNA